MPWKVIASVAGPTGSGPSKSKEAVWNVSSRVGSCESWLASLCVNVARPSERSSACSLIDVTGSSTFTLMETSPVKVAPSRSGVSEIR